MTGIIKFNMKKSIIVCLFILFFSLMISSCVTTENSDKKINVSMEKPYFQINEKTIKVMIDKAEPLIEEVTEMKYKNRVNCVVVKRDVIRDELIQDLIPQLKKL